MMIPWRKDNGDGDGGDDSEIMFCCAAAMRMICAFNACQSLLL